MLEETGEKLFEMTFRIMKATHWSYQKELSLLGKKLEIQKLESVTKIKEYETRIESIRNTSEIKIEKIPRLKED